MFIGTSHPSDKDYRKTMAVGSFTVRRLYKRQIARQLFRSILVEGDSDLK